MQEGPTAIGSPAGRGGGSRRGASPAVRALLLLLLLLAPGLQLARPASAAELFLGVEYTGGMAAPAQPPAELSAVRASRGAPVLVRCRGPPPVVSDPRQPPAAARCGGDEPLEPGLYALQAAALPGTGVPRWRCYRYHVASGEASGEAPMASPWALEVAPGGEGEAYSCIASYSPAQQQQQEQQQQPPPQQPPQMPPASAAQRERQRQPAAACGGAPAYPQPPRGAPPDPLAAEGGRLVSAATGEPVTLKGVNWGGLDEDDRGFPGTAAAGGSVTSADFGLAAYQLRQLGFNAVRLPFTWSALQRQQGAGPRAANLTARCSPVSEGALRARLIVRGEQELVTAQLPPNPGQLLNSKMGYCNTYLADVPPGPDRLLFAIQALAAQGMYVVLAYQPLGREDHARSLARFASSWAALWARVACLPNFAGDLAGRVLVDPLAAPDAMSIRWEGSAAGEPGAAELYLAAADAVWAASPGGALFLFEGAAGQAACGLGWGGGLAAGAARAAAACGRRAAAAGGGAPAPSDAGAFLEPLLGRPYAGASVLAPTLLGPAVACPGRSPCDPPPPPGGPALWAQLDEAFGYLSQPPGFCAPAAGGGSGGQASAGGSGGGKGKGSAAPPACRTFPVVVSLGSGLEPGADLSWAREAGAYAAAALGGGGGGGGATPAARPLAGWVWWSFNGGDGGAWGITSPSYRALAWDKLGFMRGTLGLTPWYMERRRVRK